ncbi:MAG TPA: RNA polymerase sigma factor [Polyangiaceae bacterium]|jgi:RNA polymerase sigma-70 factor (ECF subfamily)|nr:RNA polymerase sigma factor [Polyangiaceae bacterium]
MEELVEQAKRGDRSALEKLLSDIAPSIHRFGLRMCKNADDADDVLQDTLITVTEHLGQFEGRSSLASWVFALARSACIRRRRGLKNRPPDGEEYVSAQADVAPSPEARAADRELSAVLLRALDGLPEDYREVILLRDVEGLSAPEAASVLEISLDALKSRLHRAREALRNSLRPLLEPALVPALPGCPDMMLLWSRKLEGDLSQADCATMEQHLLSCAACGTACDGLKRALRACRSVATAEVPPEVRARVKVAMRAWADRAALRVKASGVKA